MLLYVITLIYYNSRHHHEIANLRGKLATLETVFADQIKIFDQQKIHSLTKKINALEDKIESHVEQETSKSPQATLASLSGAEQLGLDTVLLVIASNRAQYLQRSLAKVVEYHPRFDLLTNQ